MTDTPLTPSDAERAEWPDNTRNYVEWTVCLGTPPDLTNPGKIPFGELPLATREAMVIAHVLAGVALEFFDGDTWVWDEDVLWHPLTIYRVVQP